MPFYRSSSFRVAILLTLVIWSVSAGVIVAIVQLSEHTLLAQLNAAINEELGEFIELTESEELDVWEVFDDEIEDQLLPDSDLAADDLKDYLPKYIARLQALARTKKRDQASAIAVRLFFLDAGGQVAGARRPAEFYAALIVDEAPESLHGDLEDYLESRLSRWPTSLRWSRMSPAQRLNILLDAKAKTLASSGHCLRVLPPEQHAQAESFVREAPVRHGEFFAAELERSGLLKDEEALCWVRRFDLADGRVILFGRPQANTLEAVTTVRYWRDLGIALCFALAVILGLMLGRSIFARLRDINALTSEIRQGHLDRRLRLTNRNDDFDELSRNINAMLDRITHLMNGVRQVSDNIAHDLRTPLTRLRNRIEQLSQIEHPGTEDIAPIAEQADHVLATFTALLRIAQLEQGSHRRSFVKFDLASVMAEILDLYGIVFADRGTTLTTDLPEQAMMVGDRDLWMQLFTNLLENTLKYAPDSARVTMSMRRAGKVWRIEVRDQGPGVPEHALEQLTHRFFRVNPERASTGTGLGLSLVAVVCQLHGAALKFSNQGGLVVRIDWPQV